MERESEELPTIIVKAARVLILGPHIICHGFFFLCRGLLPLYGTSGDMFRGYGVERRCLWGISLCCVSGSAFLPAYGWWE